MVIMKDQELMKGELAVIKQEIRVHGYYLAITAGSACGSEYKTMAYSSSINGANSISSVLTGRGIGVGSKQFFWANFCQNGDAQYSPHLLIIDVTISVRIFPLPWA